jgi:hypothetical protein
MERGMSEKLQTQSRLTIVVSGMMARVPFQGGATWAVLQYVLGFKNLGHEVYFVEPLNQQTPPPPGTVAEKSDSVSYFNGVMETFGLLSTSALLLPDSGDTVGLSYAELRDIMRRADILINISGSLQDKTLSDNIPVRVYLDLDPAFTQLWYTTQHIDMHLNGHTHFATIGKALGSADCPIPTCGVDWITTLQPIALPYWPMVDGDTPHGITTVANWRAYGSIEHEGVFYGQKVHAMRPLMSLPAMTRDRFTLALSIHPDEKKDLSALRAHGWQLLDPRTHVNTPRAYQLFIQSSKAEFGVAKKGYVLSRCGWFSDRSVCYLASGRPVIAQDTGFSSFLPVGEGLFAFNRPDDVCAALETLQSDYSRHARTARDLAVEYFDSGKVLTSLLQRLGAAA